LGEPAIQRGVAEPGPDLEVFEAALRDLLGEMARAMAADGEGATRMVEVVVTGAPDDACARDLARSIASSPLVKAAIFGADPNWGRILATVGARAGSQGFAVDPYKARVALQGITVFEKGAPTEHDRDGLKGRMRESRVDVLVELAEGTARSVTSLVGTFRSTRSPWPSWPAELEPQTQVEPSPRTATELRLLDETAAYPSPIFTGASRVTCVPSPTWPEALWPQAQRVPSTLIATVCAAPAAIEAKPAPSCTGASRRVVVLIARRGAR